jgi:uncharacterized protein with FMN-binding domain
MVTTPMRRLLLWALTTVSMLVLLLGYRTSTSSALPAAAGPAGTTGSSGPATATARTGGPSTYTGALTGSVAQTRWGPVQVRATVAQGRITTVDVLRQPDGNRKDEEINADALPTLVQETLTAQSASIDMVSGATVTSDGYVESLQNALDQAGIA